MEGLDLSQRRQEAINAGNFHETDFIQYVVARVMTEFYTDIESGNRLFNEMINDMIICRNEMKTLMYEKYKTLVEHITDSFESGKKYKLSNDDHYTSYWIRDCNYDDIDIFCFIYENIEVFIVNHEQSLKTDKKRKKNIKNTINILKNIHMIFKNNYTEFYQILTCFDNIDTCFSLTRMYDSYTKVISNEKISNIDCACCYVFNYLKSNEYRVFESVFTNIYIQNLVCIMGKMLDPKYMIDEHKMSSLFVDNTCDSYVRMDMEMENITITSVPVDIIHNIGLILYEIFEIGVLPPQHDIPTFRRMHFKEVRSQYNNMKKEKELDILYHRIGDNDYELPFDLKLLMFSIKSTEEYSNTETEFSRQCLRAINDIIKQNDVVKQNETLQNTNNDWRNQNNNNWRNQNNNIVDLNTKQCNKFIAMTNYYIHLQILSLCNNINVGDSFDIENGIIVNRDQNMNETIQMYNDYHEIIKLKTTIGELWDRLYNHNVNYGSYNYGGSLVKNNSISIDGHDIDMYEFVACTLHTITVCRIKITDDSREEGRRVYDYSNHMQSQIVHSTQVVSLIDDYRTCSELSMNYYNNRRNNAESGKAYSAKRYAENTLEKLNSFKH